MLAMPIALLEVIYVLFFFPKMPAWLSLLQLGEVFLSLKLHLDVGAMWHTCVLWEETPRVPPNFKSSMLEELWHSMPQSGRVSVTVNSLLQRYKEHCRAERKRLRHSAESPPALLPVSFAQAKDWLLKQTQSEALQTGAVNEDAREVVADLNRSLAEQPASTAALLEQPAHPASPVVPPPVMSLGPEPVTDQVRAEERARRQAEELRVASG